MVNAMDWLYSQKEYNTREKREGVRKLVINNIGLEGHLDLREFVNLTKLNCSYDDLTSLDVSQNVNLTKLECSDNYLTSLDVSNCPKLTDLFIDAELFIPENKIIGLEKTSIIRLDCQGGDLLTESQDPQFIWQTFLNKYNMSFPEMKLLDISDLNELASQLNETTKNDGEFLKKTGNEGFKGNYYWILDCLANQILGRCLIIQNRLYDKPDEEYEIELIIRAKALKCRAMNPKHPEASLYSTREKLVNQALSGDKSLLAKLQDLPYLNPKYKLENMLKIQELTQAKSQISQQTQTEFGTQDKGVQTELTAQQITQLETNNQQLLKLLQATEQELANTKNQLTQIQEKANHLEKQKTQNNQTITNLEGQIEIKKGELQQGKDTNNKLFSELTTAKNQSATNQEKIKQLQSKIKLLEQQKETYQTKYDKSVEFIREIREDIAKM